jgi:hypothetical protein
MFLPKKQHMEVATGLIRHSTSVNSNLPKDWSGISMVIRLKDTVIESVDDTETRRLKLIKMSSKANGATITIELPEALSGTLSLGETVNVVIDSKEIAKGEDAKLYVEGTLFKKSENDGLEIIGSIGGLRLVLNMAKTTPSQTKTFDSSTFYVAIK